MRELLAGLGVFKDAEPVDASAVPRRAGYMGCADNRCGVVISAGGPSFRRSRHFVMHRQVRSDQPSPVTTTAVDHTPPR